MKGLGRKRCSMLEWFLRVRLRGLVAILCTVTAAQTQPRVMLYSVRPGDSLGRIAKRHDVTIEALCRANVRTRQQKIFPGDRLIIPATPSSPIRPHVTPVTTQAPPVTRDIEIRSDEARVEPTLTLPSAIWHRYARQPRARGYVVLEGYGRRYSGYAAAVGGVVSSDTRAAFSRLLFNHHTGEETELSGRLVQLLVQVSDTFGGRTINIASGYRESSFAPESRHPHGAACDFSVTGVPNLALFAYLSTLPHVGIGYYPNSTMVHLDVRSKRSVWVDLSGPGEPPRYVEPVAYFKTVRAFDGRTGDDVE